MRREGFSRGVKQSLNNASNNKRVDVENFIARWYPRAAPRGRAVKKLKAQVQLPDQSRLMPWVYRGKNSPSLRVALQDLPKFPEVSWYAGPAAGLGRARPRMMFML